jgi:hypothetical protein
MGGSAGKAPADAAVEALVEMHDDASTIPVPCTNNLATFGTRLRAGGMTPTTFADAYNAELDALSGPGPFLMVLSGVNDDTPASWIGAFGALALGQPVHFASGHADVPFTIGADRSITIVPTATSFNLRFGAQGSDVLVPVAQIGLSGTLMTQCGSLGMAQVRFLVPATAGSVAFHASTIGALMGTPTEMLGGQAASAWPLELSGTAKQVYAPGVLDDAGTP